MIMAGLFVAYSLAKRIIVSSGTSVSCDVFSTVHSSASSLIKSNTVLYPFGISASSALNAGLTFF